MAGVFLLAFCLITFHVVHGALPVDPNWRLAFSDDFSGNTLDTTKWTARYKNGNYGENEQHYYVPEQVSVRNGNLVINSTKVRHIDKDYISGWIDSKDKSQLTYGRYQVRMKPSGTYGLWPAAWMVSQTRCVWWGHEYDIAEYVGRMPNRMVQSVWYFTQPRCSNNLGERSMADSSTTFSNPTIDLSADYHEYTMDLLEDKIIFYIDGVETRTQPFRANNLGGAIDPTPHFWILNVAVGGYYPENPRANTVWPTFSYFDYVRTYVYRASCSAANVCSGHGCCNGTTILCQCDPGWVGSNCEFYAGSFVNNFVTGKIEYTPVTDFFVNGWDNGQAMYNALNVNINNGLTLTINTLNCPAGCIGKPYAAGAWNSATWYTYGTFSVTAKGTNIPGTSLSIGAFGQYSPLEQIMLVQLGSNPRQMLIQSWHTGYYFLHATINLGFDASSAYHNYSFVYNPTSMQFYVDGILVRSTTEVVPSGTLALGVYFTVDPSTADQFVYRNPITANIQQATWQIRPGGEQFRIGNSCDVDECAAVPGPCDPNASCSNSLGSFTCTCKQGYSGSGYTCSDVNECAQSNLNNCGANSVCTNTPGSFSCSCASGFTGNGITCSDVNECATPSGNNCSLDAECENSIGSYSCTCKQGFSGTGFTCKDINECENGYCSRNAICTNTVGSYQCACANGYSGNGITCNDINECATGFVNNCSSNAICTNSPGSYSCICQPGYSGTGVVCSDVNECANGFVNNCSASASCSNIQGSYSCTCNRGYSGNGFTCTDINECAAGGGNNCNANAVCTNTPGSFSCSCKPGYSGNGQTCSDINECASGFVNNCSSSASCSNTQGSYVCSCNRGYSGNGITCTDINECATGYVNNCSSNAICTNTQGSYSCTCRPGYSGTGLVCNDVNECATGFANNCSSSASCSNSQGSYSCACNRGYSGNGFTCTDINECASGFVNNCSANAVCTNSPGSYSCACRPGYSGNGLVCTDINECANGFVNNCSANAVCSNIQGKFELKKVRL